jgi:ketol-acid reductoisomerase
LCSSGKSSTQVRLYLQTPFLFLSFGNQGSAQAQNLRDSGIPNDQILIANRVDSYAETAKAKGFHVEHDFATAAEVADGMHELILFNYD